MYIVWVNGYVDSGNRIGYHLIPYLTHIRENPPGIGFTRPICVGFRITRRAWVFLASLLETHLNFDTCYVSAIGLGVTGVLKCVTGVDLVSDVFNQSKLDELTGNNAIGHVRYSTAGQSMLKNVAEFEQNGSIFAPSSDTEVVLHLIVVSQERSFLIRVIEACKKLKGAYSFVFITEDKLVAVGDPFGFRSLVMGRQSNGAIVFVSKTCMLDLIKAKYEREVEPDELLIVDKDGVQSSCLVPHPEPKSCSVYESRRIFGEILATESPVDCDVVIAVLDSGVVATIGYANKASVPFQQGLIRSHYVGKTFIEPSQQIRDFEVNLT
ncbi:putative amidophosphoribosyltransferase [Helianthus annuus]|nr:putative amidophosphoribosyltransferase [Helianthus annuus]